MANLVIGNAMSLNMITENCNLNIRKMTLDEIIELVNAAPTVTSIIGHVDTAAVVSGILGIPVQANRVSWSWTDNEDTLIVAQLTGPRLPEGATELPEGAVLTWWLIEKH